MTLSKRGSYYSVARKDESSVVNATLICPASKPMTQRYLVAAALSEGDCEIRNALICGETETMMQALSALGAHFQISGTTVLVRGAGGDIKPPKLKACERKDNRAMMDQTLGAELDIYAEGSGLVLRTIGAICAACEAPISLGGNARLNQRPINPLLRAFVELGFGLELHKDGSWVDAAEMLQEDNWCPPFRITGSPLEGAKRIVIPGDVSSQFFTAILFGIPMVQPRGKPETVDLVIEPGTKLFSTSYIRQTLEVLEEFSVRFTVLDENDQPIDYRDITKKPRCFRIEPGQTFVSKKVVDIEGDYTSASYPMAAIALHKGTLVIRGLREDSLQGEALMIPFLRELLGEQQVSFDGDQLTIRNEAGIKPKSYAFDLSDGPNVTPTLMAIAAGGPSGLTLKLTGSDLTRYHKTPRVESMAKALVSVGADAQLLRDEKLGHVRGCELSAPANYKEPNEPLDYAGDHRLAMSLAVLASKVPGNTPVRGLSQIDLSYPQFLDDMDAMGLKIDRVA